MNSKIEIYVRNKIFFSRDNVLKIQDYSCKIQKLCPKIVAPVAEGRDGIELTWK